MKSVEQAIVTGVTLAVAGVVTVAVIAANWDVLVQSVKMALR